MSVTRDCRDRTTEFFNTVSSLQKQTQIIPPELSSPTPLTKKTQFSQDAARCSSGLSTITQKLESLATLARKSTLFDDRNQEINELVYTIKTDLANLNTEIDQLEHLAVSHVQSLNPQSKENSGLVVEKLKFDVRSTMKEFGQILNSRTQNLKEQNSRRKHFESSDRRRSRKPASSFRDLEPTPVSEGGGVFPESQETDTDGNHRQGRGAQLQSQVLAEQVQERDEYLQSRQTAMEEIQSTIGELAQMYQRFSTLLDMQNEVVLKIDENMDVTLDNVEKGHKELTTLFNWKSNSTWLIVKVFAIVIFFVIFFLIKF